MKLLSLLTWVGQFGLSIIFPTLFFLILAVWLQNKYHLGMWIIIVLGTLGVLTTISTARANLKALLKAVEEASGTEEPPSVSFNDHK